MSSILESGAKMGFIAKLLIVYLILAFIAGISFVRKKKAIGIGVLVLMAAGIIILMYMLLTSPM